MNPTAQPWKTAILIAFALACTLMFAYLYSGTGARVPVPGRDDYTVRFRTTDAGNLVKASDVRIAGVQVGEVTEVRNEGVDGAVITVRLDREEAFPLHDGAEVRVGERSLVGEGVVVIKDGDGPKLDAGAVLPARSVQPAVQLHDVLRSLDKPTRDALQGVVRSLGDGAEGREKEIAQLFQALGYLGGGGRVVTDAVAAQSENLTDLVSRTSTLLAALHTSEGELGQLIASADSVTRATAGQERSIQQTVRRLPAALKDGRTAFADLRALATDLRPVAENLRVAAPHLTTALTQLPATSRDLRALLPDLDSVLERAPATLVKVPAFATDVSRLVPDARDLFAQANPMLRYIAPYDRDLAAFFTNFGAVMATTDEAGLNYIRLAPVMGNTATVQGVPVYTGELTHTENPYPRPGGAEDPSGHQRDFTRIEPDPR